MSIFIHINKNSIVITYKHFSPGCTAVSCIITPSMRLIVANAGDSRICLSKNGKEVVISVDHKPTDKIEYARIVAAGATLREGRINGNLAFSRAFGDFEFKMNAELTPQQQGLIFFSY